MGLFIPIVFGIIGTVVILIIDEIRIRKENKRAQLIARLNELIRN